MVSLPVSETPLHETIVVIADERNNTSTTYNGDADTPIAPVEETTSDADPKDAPIEETTSTKKNSDSSPDEKKKSGAGHRKVSEKSWDNADSKIVSSPSADSSSFVDPSVTIPIVPTNGVAPPLVIMGTSGSATLGYTNLAPESDVESPPSSGIPGVGKGATVAIFLGGTFLLFSALALCLFLKYRRTNSKTEEGLMSKVSWETSSGQSEDLEKGESTHRISGVPSEARTDLSNPENGHRTSVLPTGPSADWSTLPVVSEKWDVNSDSYVDSEDIHSIASTIPASVPEDIDFAPPPQLHVSSDGFSPVRPRNFFDNEALLSVDSSFISPYSEGFSKEWETETVRRW